MHTSIYTLLFVFLCIRGPLQATPADYNWKTVVTEQLNGISAQFKIRNNPNLTLKDWLCLEIKNHTGKPLLIEHAVFTIDCEIFEKKGGKFLYSGKIASRSVSELFDHSLDAPIPMTELLPGINTSSLYPSTIGAYLLAIPDLPQVYVKAKLNLAVQFKGSQDFLLTWENIKFRFNWSRPEPIDMSELYQKLDHLLANPVYSTLQHFELSTLLQQPDISQGIDPSILVAALKVRNGKEDGRLAILHHLDQNFPNNKDLLDYYAHLLQTADPVGVYDLSYVSNIWDDRFMEAIIGQYEAGTKEQMVRAMRVLFKNQHRWIDKQNISEILSDLTVYKFEDIIYESPEALDRNQLLTAALVLDLLGKTGDEKMIDIICPFLEEKERILDTGLEIDPNSLALPRPMRVCDNALEAIFRLTKTDIIKTYQKADFRPPYEHGEGEIIISRIRDQAIANIKEKTCPN